MEKSCLYYSNLGAIITISNVVITFLLRNITSFIMIPMWSKHFYFRKSNIVHNHTLLINKIGRKTGFLKNCENSFAHVFLQYLQSLQYLIILKKKIFKKLEKMNNSYTTHVFPDICVFLLLVRLCFDCEAVMPGPECFIWLCLF